MGANEVAVRFRHTCGVDSGPYPFPLAASISSLKEKLLAEWPAGKPGRVADRTSWVVLLLLPFVACATRGSRPCAGSSRRISYLPPLVAGTHRLDRTAEGPLAGERPASVAEIKLICSGKFLENNVVLGSESFLRSCHFYV